MGKYWPCAPCIRLRQLRISLVNLFLKECHGSTHSFDSEANRSSRQQVTLRSRFAYLRSWTRQCFVELLRHPWAGGGPTYEIVTTAHAVPAVLLLEPIGCNAATFWNGDRSPHSVLTALQTYRRGSVYRSKALGGERGVTLTLTLIYVQLSSPGFVGP